MNARVPVQTVSGTYPYVGYHPTPKTFCTPLYAYILGDLNA
jgi:hypothetical protein